VWVPGHLRAFVSRTHDPEPLGKNRLRIEDNNSARVSGSGVIVVDSERRWR